MEYLWLLWARERRGWRGWREWWTLCRQGFHFGILREGFQLWADSRDAFRVQGVHLWFLWGWLSCAWDRICCESDTHGLSGGAGVSVPLAQRVQRVQRPNLLLLRWLLRWLIRFPWVMYGSLWAAETVDLWFVHSNATHAANATNAFASATAGWPLLASSEYVGCQGRLLFKCLQWLH